MKRIKIMMLSFALLAIVGGALAFKAKYQGFDACYTTTNVGQITCKDALETTYKFTNVSPSTIIYTTTKVTLSGTPQCEFSTDGTTPLTLCTQPFTVTKDN